MSKFLSLSWFKEKIERTTDKVIENVMSKKLENLIDQLQNEEETSVPTEKLYNKIKFVNNVLTIVTNEGEIITKHPATVEDFEKVKNATSINEIMNVVTFPELLKEKIKKEAEDKKIKTLLNGTDLLLATGDFEMIDNSVYLKGINRSLPQLLVEKFIEIVSTYENCEGDLQARVNDNEVYLAHKRFFMWCCLNPRAEVANELYRFLTENSFRITKQGFFTALRNVVTLHGSPELVHFISNTYNKVKAVWKKSPDAYHVILQSDGSYKLINKSDMYKEETQKCDTCEGSGRIWDEDENDYVDCYDCDGQGRFTSSVKNYDGEDLGILTDLYLDLPNRAENRFTDDWTKTFDIRIGQVVNMPKEECNWSTQDCAAAGLHFTANEIHYVGCGDQSVLVVINPINFVA